MVRGAGYWDDRYGRGGTSGSGSVGSLRDWKWGIIETYVDPGTSSIIDYGCGDLSFWEGRDARQYVGLDISCKVIDADRKKRPEWEFYCIASGECPDIRADAVFCLDVLFHIMDDAEYRNILERLCRMAEKSIVIFTWDRNPFAVSAYRHGAQLNLLRSLRLGTFLYSLFGEMTSDYIYEKYRNVNDYLDIFRRYGYAITHSARTELNPFGSMYVFERISVK
jgi:2-polyprenyl-3-methyl-5-hydroxy-6-metoxy-1,4-benzoquinol methylase